MTKVYASTRWGQKEMLKDYLDDLEQQGVELKIEDQRATEKYLSRIIFDSIYDSVIGASNIMDWLKLCADKIASINGALVWQTPVGFKVRQKYMTQESARVRTQINGGVTLRYLKDTLRVHKGDNKAAVSANFVHSMDAAHLIMTVDTMTHDMAESDEVPAWAMVHDQFGCHALDADRLADTLREQFCEMYQMNEPLVAFQRGLEAEHQIDLPDPPEMGELDIRQVLESAFFFH